MTVQTIDILLAVGRNNGGGGSHAGGHLQSRRGSMQLWQFLVALLDDNKNGAFITWTGRGMEFKLIDPEEVIILHTQRSNSMSHHH